MLKAVGVWIRGMLDRVSSSTQCQDTVGYFNA